MCSRAALLMDSTGSCQGRLLRLCLLLLCGPQTLRLYWYLWIVGRCFSELFSRMIRDRFPDLVAHLLSTKLLTSAANVHPHRKQPRTIGPTQVNEIPHDCIPTMCGRLRHRSVVGAPGKKLGTRRRNVPGSSLLVLSGCLPRRSLRLRPVKATRSASLKGIMAGFTGETSDECIVQWMNYNMFSSHAARERLRGPFLCPRFGATC